MENKIRGIIFDYDGVVISSGDAICSLYNLDVVNIDDENFKTADFSKCVKWDMSDVVPLMDSTQQENMFASKEFFNVVKFNVGMKDLINRLHDEGYEIIFCSRGTVGNINKKNEWLYKHFPFAIMLPVIGNWDKSIDKDWINMNECVFIDDKNSNLDNSNASLKILYNEHGLFNREWNCSVSAKYDRSSSTFGIYKLIKDYEEKNTVRLTN